MELLNKLKEYLSKEQLEVTPKSSPLENILTKEPITNIKRVIFTEKMYAWLHKYAEKNALTGFEHGFECKYRQEGSDIIITKISEKSPIRTLGLRLQGNYGFSRYEASLILGGHDLHTHTSPLTNVNIYDPMGMINEENIDSLIKKATDFAQFEFGKQIKFSKQDIDVAEKTNLFGIISYLNSKEILMRCLWKGEKISCYVKKEGILTQITENPKNLELTILGKTIEYPLIEKIPPENNKEPEGSMCIRPGKATVTFAQNINGKIPFISQFIANVAKVQLNYPDI